MKGHTDKATVNQRRPMSETMRSLLKWLDSEDIPHRLLSNGDKNRMCALMDRGYAVPTTDGAKWIITSVGREARRADIR